MPQHNAGNPSVLSGMFISWIINFCLPVYLLLLFLSYPRCHLGTTVDCTTNGVGPIRGWFSSFQNLSTYLLTSSPCWASTRSRGTQRRQLFDICVVGWWVDLFGVWKFLHWATLKPSLNLVGLRTSEAALAPHWSNELCRRKKCCLTSNHGCCTRDIC
jgi:hypothetical protein